MLTRQFELRAETATEDRIVRGIAVPFNDPVDVGGYKEMIAPNAVMPRDNIKLFYGHDEPIGRVIDSKDTDAGWSITAKISETSRGNEVYTLLKDGVLDRFSIGFMPMEENEDKNGTIVRTKIDVREVSIVPIPAYEGAKVEEVRNAQDVAPIENKEIDVDNVAIEEMRESVEALERKVSTLSIVEAAPVVDTRSAGTVLKAIVAGEERAYTGGTSADAIVKNAWVGDLTRLVEGASVLRGVFGSASLPNEGNFIEYGQLKTDTSAFAKQAAEGDDLTFGKIQVETKSAPVYTYGGYTQLTLQEIQRSATNILDFHLRAQAIKVGQVLNGVVRADYKALHAAQLVALNMVDVSAAALYNGWLDAIIEAAVKFDALGLPINALVADKATFKTLAKLQGADGRPVMLVAGNGSNNVGSIDVKGLGGNIANVKVVLDAGLAANESAFVNSNAIRFYTSPIVRLQDENIINLSKDFSVYTYAAVADEMPSAVVPVKPVA